MVGIVVFYKILIHNLSLPLAVSFCLHPSLLPFLRDIDIETHKSDCRIFYLSFERKNCSNHESSCFLILTEGFL